MIVIHTVLTALVLNLYLIFQCFDVGAKALFILLGCVYFISLCVFPVFFKKHGRKMRILHGGQVLLNLSYRFVKLFDGENDGLVSADSMKWGSKFTFLEPKGKRGITHGDVIDLNRENIKGFDVREFYVGLVSDLREKGY